MEDVDFIRKEWMRDRNRHPYVGEGKNASDIACMWEAGSSTYSFDRYSGIRDSIVDRLLETGHLNGTILDIGCGPGTYAIPFSKHAKHIIATDSSKGMLARLKDDCDAFGISNIETVLCDCTEIPSEYGSDLVFCSLCPPMNSPESLEYMMSLGKTSAYVSSCSFSDGLEIRIWNALGKDYSYCGYNTDYPYRYLKSSGFDATLELFSQKNHSEFTVEQSIARFESLISRYRNLDDEMRSKIAQTVEDDSEDGIVYTDTTVTMGLLIWSV